MLDWLAVLAQTCRTLLACCLLALAGCTTADLPLLGKPAAHIDGGHDISRSEYQTRLDLYRSLNQKQTALNGTQQAVPGSTQGHSDELQLEDKAVGDLVNEELMREQAATMRLTVSEKEVDQQVTFLQQALTSSPTGPTTLTQFLHTYGYTMQLLRNQLRARLVQVKVENKLALERAQKAYEVLHSGAQFADVARKYSDDRSSAAKGGEIDMTPKDLALVDSALRPIIDFLQPGATGNGPVRAQSGFFVLRLLARDPSGVKVLVIYTYGPDAQHFRENNVPQWFKDYVSGLQKQAHVRYYVGSRAEA